MKQTLTTLFMLAAVGSAWAAVYFDNVPFRGIKVEKIQVKFRKSWTRTDNGIQRRDSMKNIATQARPDSIERYYFACKLANGKSVLDIACRAGHSTPQFVQAGVSSYDGVDINERLVAYAKHKYKTAKVNFHVGDICTFNKGKTFDIISCYGTLEHVKDYEAAINNLYKLLDHGGLLFISSANRMVTSPHCSSINDKPAHRFHCQEFTPKELLLLLSSYGFSVWQSKVFGQRQRQLYPSKFLNKLVGTVAAKSNKASAVTVVKNKAPAHFIVVAKKE